jgi:replicative DNA helicase
MPVRTPPCNTEIEQALLGAMLVNNGAYERTCEILQPEHFYDPVHGRIFKAIATLIGRGQVADPKTLRSLFDNDPALTALGGGARYLADLAASAKIEDFSRFEE